MNHQELKDKFNTLTNQSTLPELQNYISEMIETRGFEKETPRDVMLLLTEEVGELAKEVRKTTGMKLDVEASRKSGLGDEIADVFMYILSMCKATDINLFDAFQKKEEKNFKRTWN